MKTNNENKIGMQLTKQFYSKFSRRWESKTVEIVKEYMKYGTIRMYLVKFLKSGRFVEWNADVADSYEGWVK